MAFNKKGMMDDFFDFMFTVTAAFFLLLFIGTIFDESVKNSQLETFNELVPFESKRILVDYLKKPLNQEEMLAKYQADINGELTISELIILAENDVNLKRALKLLVCDDISSQNNLPYLRRFTGLKIKYPGDTSLEGKDGCSPTSDNKVASLTLNSPSGGAIIVNIMGRKSDW